MRKLFIITITLLCAITICFADGTKSWKFLEYGIYIVPEDFPDKFLNFPSRYLGKDIIANKAVMGLVEHESEATPDGDILFILVACYSDSDIVHILAIQTVSAIGRDPKKWTSCSYVDEQLLKTGKPSFILTKADKKLDLEKFKRERELEFGKVAI